MREHLGAAAQLLLVLRFVKLTLIAFAHCLIALRRVVAEVEAVRAAWRKLAKSRRRR